MIDTQIEDAELSLMAVRQLTRDVRNAAVTLTDRQARFLVDLYYIWQEDRKRAYNQERSLDEASEPHAIITWAAENAGLMEREIRAALTRYAASRIPGRWAQSIVGIGPVIAAGLLAHVDPTRCRTAGQLWRFAGLDPTVRWERGMKRPWNAALKVLAWKIGESFVKVQNHPNDIYGHLFAKRKRDEWLRNLAGIYAPQAAEQLRLKAIHPNRPSYAWLSGQYAGAVFSTAGIVPTPADANHPGVPMLSPAHIHARARRWATKLFLAHYQAVAYEDKFHEPPPKPYVIAMLGHADYIGPPNWPLA